MIPTSGTENVKFNCNQTSPTDFRCIRSRNECPVHNSCFGANKIILELCRLHIQIFIFHCPPPQRTISNKSGFRPPSCNCYLVKAFLFNLKILNARPFLDNQTKKISFVLMRLVKRGFLKKINSQRL